MYSCVSVNVHCYGFLCFYNSADASLGPEQATFLLYWTIADM
jgi:hypothetical protein